MHRADDFHSLSFLVANGKAFDLCQCQVHRIVSGALCVDGRARARA
jgi:hypothetical protein